MNAKTTVPVIRTLAFLIMFVAFAVSYFTQLQLLQRWHVDLPAAIGIPFTIDLLAIIATLVIHTHDVKAESKRVALRVLLLAGTVSMAANLLSGDTWGSRIAHAWTVGAYLLGEWLGTKVSPETKDAKRSEAAKRGAATRKAKAAVKTPAAKPSVRGRRLAAVPN